MSPLDRTLPWVVAFGGADREGAVLELRRGVEEVTAVLVPRRRSAKLEASVRTLREAGLSTIEVSRSELEQALAPYEGLPLLSVGFPYILPATALMRHPIAVNLHPTLLPKYRGPTSAAYILINDEKESGSTAHFMTADVDDGDIIAQRSFALTPFDTVRSVQRKSYALETALVNDLLEALHEGQCGTAQDASLASTYPKPRTPEDSRVDPTLPLVELVNAIRGCDPVNYPAFFEYHGEKMCIRLWRPEKPDEDEDCL